MNYMQYIKAEDNYLIDVLSHSFIMSRQLVSSDVYVMPCFWNYIEKDMHKDVLPNGVVVTSHKSELLMFNGCSVKFSPVDCSSATINFFSYRTNCDTQIKISKSQFGTIDGCRSCFAVYDLCSSEGKRSIGVNIVLEDANGQNFYHVPGLCAHRDYDYLSYGMSHTPYDVVFGTKVFDKKYYILMCGLWGILFDSEFSFDSIVLFSKVDATTVYINKIIHTEDTKKVKYLILAITP